MSSAVWWALITAGASSVFIALIVLTCERIVVRRARRRDTADATNVLDNVTATAVAAEGHNRSVYVMADEATAGDDFELWRLECGWS